MKGLNEAIDERVSFLREQINPKNKPLVNQSFQVQIQTLREADPERIAILILQKEKQLERVKDMTEIEVLYSEIDAMKWLQREVVQRMA